MTDVIIVAVIVLIIGLAALYIYKTKKSGQKCVGCPYSKQCSGKTGCCGCGTDKTDGSENSNNL